MALLSGERFQVMSHFNSYVLTLHRTQIWLSLSQALRLHNIRMIEKRRKTPEGTKLRQMRDMF
jgi:hypothetical protein